MKFGNYIDSEFDILCCPHATLTAEGVVHDGSTYPHPWRLFFAFNEMRSRFGKPLAITQGFRCPECQKRLIKDPRFRAAKNSEHCHYKALDVRPWAFRATPPGGFPDAEARELRRQIRRLRLLLDEIDPDIRIGTAVYSDELLHLGCGWELSPNPEPRNWARGVRF